MQREAEIPRRMMGSDGRFRVFFRVARIRTDGPAVEGWFGARPWLERVVIVTMSPGWERCKRFVGGIGRPCVVVDRSTDVLAGPDIVGSMKSPRRVRLAMNPSHPWFGK